MTAENSQKEVCFKLRNDLQFADYPIGVSSQTVVKDPLKMEYFLFDSIEKSLLQLLQKPRTLGDLKQLADQKLSDTKLEISEIKFFLKRLLNDNLIIAESTGMGTSLLDSKRRSNNARWLQAVFGILAIRFRGIHPQWLLDSLNPVTRFVFRPTFLLAALVAFAIAMVTMILNAATIFESQYLWKSIQSVRILIPIALALGVVKILHELGHAFACRSINRDCTEMGVMLLAFIPCLYCNVSDVWMESNRWKRMLVSAAGIYVEMLIAAICVPLWMYSNSGELKLFWFTLMTICSVNTLLINGNPLLRYDGYYLLSDAVGVPNLYAKAQNALSDRVASFFLRDSQSRPFSWLEIYGFSALLYRYFIVGAIVFTIYLFFVRMELATFGLLVALAIGTLTLTGTAIGTTRRLLRLRNQRNLRRGRIAWVLLTLMAILISGMFVPISSKIYADGEVVFAGNKMVFAPDYGKIRWLVGNGQKVQVGSNIAVIQNLDLELKIREQDAYVQQLEKTQEHLSLLQAQGADNSREIELHKQSLENAKKIAAEFEVQLDQLSLKSKAQGSLVALPASMNKRKATLDLTRSDSTLNPVNRNSFVEAGEPVAVVSSGSDQIVRLRIPERAADRVTAGQSVDLLINQYSPEILDGIVADIAIDTPTNLDAMEEIDDQKWIVVTVKLAQPSDEIFLNSKVKAVIHAGDESVYQCIKRILTDNFSY